MIDIEENKNYTDFLIINGYMDKYIMWDTRNRYNMNVKYVDLLKNIESHRMNLVKKYRQSGSSTFLCGYALSKLLLGNDIVYFTFSYNQSKFFCDKICDFVKNVLNIKLFRENNTLFYGNNILSFKNVRSVFGYGDSLCYDVLICDEVADEFITNTSIPKYNVKGNGKEIYFNDAIEVYYDYNIFNNIYDSLSKGFKGDDVYIDEFKWYYNESLCKDLKLSKEFESGNGKFTTVNLLVNFNDIISNTSPLDFMLSDGWELNSDYVNTLKKLKQWNSVRKCKDFDINKFRENYDMDNFERMCLLLFEVLDNKDKNYIFEYVK